MDPMGNEDLLPTSPFQGFTESDFYGRGLDVQGFDVRGMLGDLHDDPGRAPSSRGFLGMIARVSGCSWIGC
jgi:hypothetical protein